MYRFSSMQTQTRWREAALIVIAWAAVVAWALAIYALSNQPGDPGAGGGRLRLSWEKIAHFAVFGVLSVGIANALTVSRVQSRRFWWTFVLCALYAVADELHQVLVPHRHPSVIDVMIDMAGASTGYFAFRQALHRLKLPWWTGGLRSSRRRARRTIRDARMGGRVR